MTQALGLRHPVATLRHGADPAPSAAHAQVLRSQPPGHHRQRCSAQARHAQLQCRLWSLSSAGAGKTLLLGTPSRCPRPRSPHPSLHTPRGSVSRKQEGSPSPHSHTYSQAKQETQKGSSPARSSLKGRNPGARGPACHGIQTSVRSQGTAHRAQGHSKGACAPPQQGGVPGHHWSREAQGHASWDTNSDSQGLACPSCQADRVLGGERDPQGSDTWLGADCLP